MTHMQQTRVPWWTGALSGVLAAAAGVGVATGVAALLTGVPSPVESIGNRAIDLTPRFLKEFAIRQFGENDKPVLIGGMVVTLFVAALLLEVLATILDKVPGWPVGRVPSQRGLQRERPLV